MRSTAFRDMTTAPRDGTIIEVRQGPDQQAVRACWAGQTQAFVGADDPHRTTLHQVTGWRPAPAALRPFRPISSAPPDTAVEVVHGTRQAMTLARWDGQRHLWIRVKDPRNRVRLQVTAWRPAK